LTRCLKILGNSAIVYFLPGSSPSYSYAPLALLHTPREPLQATRPTLFAHFVQVAALRFNGSLNFIPTPRLCSLQRLPPRPIHRLLLKHEVQRLRLIGRPIPLHPMPSKFLTFFATVWLSLALWTTLAAAYGTGFTGEKVISGFYPSYAQSPAVRFPFFRKTLSKTLNLHSILNCRTSIMPLTPTSTTSSLLQLHQPLRSLKRESTTRRLSTSLRERKQRGSEPGTQLVDLLVASISVATSLLHRTERSLHELSSRFWISTDLTAVFQLIGSTREFRVRHLVPFHPRDRTDSLEYTGQGDNIVK